MRALLFLFLAGCFDFFDDVDCGCPSNSNGHPTTGQLASIEGGRILSFEGDELTVQEADGSTSRYRVRQGMTTFTRTGSTFCGRRPEAFGRRTFSIGSNVGGVLELVVTAEPGHRFISTMDAIVSFDTGQLAAETELAPDGSTIGIRIDLARTASSNLRVSGTWTIETPDGTIDEIVLIPVNRTPTTTIDTTCL